MTRVWKRLQKEDSLELRRRLPGPAINIVDKIFTNMLRNLVLKRFRKANNTYPEDVRKVSLMLHFYSAKAPLRKWAAVIVGRPDFNRDSFNRVTQEALEERLLVSLMINEMRTKKQVDWDGKEVIRYCDLGHGIINNDIVAYGKHALVFLAVAVNRSWEIPLGFTLIDSLESGIQANLLYRALYACQRLKFMRNLLAEKQCTRDGEGRVVAWKYPEALGSLQPKGGFHGANKLRKQNVDVQSQNMKISLAGQTLSRAEKGIRCFGGVEATGEFATTVDNILDLSNSCHPLGRGNKAPPLSRRARKTLIFGFLLVLEYIKGLDEDLDMVPSPPFRCLLTKKPSQDHLELFFATVLNRTDNNDNPTPFEFRSASRKCLVASVLPSTRGNCQVDGSATLLVSSSGRHQ
ncbi:hypothetical protein HPB47_007695 [Ixodes persulcatus]|uniref:Uncharacterized protein n=1 Tax=Ixodes persulcatus TaxID=34615 RepID=A0AC60P717_IXOPE|nr:hypothetical protein HPB47_007695 [Ixodes persulcatus]